MTDPKGAHRLATRLAKARHDLGWSQGVLARRSGVGRTHIVALEQGKLPNVSAQIVMRLAGALGKPIDWLLGVVD